MATPFAGAPGSEMLCTSATALPGRCAFRQPNTAATATSAKQPASVVGNCLLSDSSREPYTLAVSAEKSQFACHVEAPGVREHRAMGHDGFAVVSHLDCGNWQNCAEVGSDFGARAISVV